MAEFKKVVTAESIRKGFNDLLEKIIDRINQQFANPLVIEFYEPSVDDWTPQSLSFLYIAEISKKYWFGIIPHEKKRKLFAISPNFHGAAFDEKTILCNVFDSSILGVVKEEVGTFADSHEATDVHLSEES